MSLGIPIQRKVEVSGLNSAYIIRVSLREFMKCEQPGSAPFSNSGVKFVFFVRSFVLSTPGDSYV